MAPGRQSRSVLCPVASVVSALVIHTDDQSISDDGSLSEHRDGPESDSESEDETETNVAGPLPPQAFTGTFEIDTKIDIDMTASRDMVAVEPVAREEEEETPKVTQQITVVAANIEGNRRCSCPWKNT